jgi:UPF0755 protein
MKRSRILFMRLFITIGLAVVLVGAALAWKPYKAIYINGVPDRLSETFVNIPTGSSFDDLVHILAGGGFIEDEDGFRWVAEKMSYTGKVRPGRFKIQPGWNNRELIAHLRAGRQAPVMVVLNNERLPEDVAGKVARFLEADSLELLRAFRNPTLLRKYGLTQATLMSIFIPNSYEFFWNTTAEAFLERMAREHDAFWNKDDRRARARALDLTPEEAYTLASIVERETNANIEKATIAGVYLNRLQKGMLLQADPTCVFATRDFATRRVTQYHTKYDSPYNTYKYKGLPPGPISTASIASIDAVLNPEQHDYLYFCAKPDESGTHAFAVTYKAHLVNAERFHAWQIRKYGAANDK